MRTFLPQFKIAVRLGEQRRLLSKIGGLPWGLPQEKWPICCRHPEKLLAQFVHEPPMLNLGADGNVLHLFQCLDCGLGDRGCDAFILHKSGLGEGLSRISGWDRLPTYGPKLIGELWLDGWLEKDDGIPANRLSEFFEERAWGALHNEFANIEWFDGREMTRFGGGPRWTGWGPMCFSPAPFEFLLQLDSRVYIKGAQPRAKDVGCNVDVFEKSQGNQTVHRIERLMAEEPVNAPWGVIYSSGDEDFGVEYTNFGSDGTAFVFIDRHQSPPAVKWFWNR